MRSIGPAVTREQCPAFLRNSSGRLDFPGPTQEASWISRRNSRIPPQLAAKPPNLIIISCSLFLFLVTKVVGTSVFSLLLLLLLSSCLIHVLMSRFWASCCNKLWYHRQDLLVAKASVRRKQERLENAPQGDRWAEHRLDKEWGLCTLLFTTNKE